MPFRLDWKWNGEGIRLTTLRNFFESRGFDLHKEWVEIRIDEEGNWDFFNKPKIEPEPEKEEDPEPVRKPRVKPLCVKCHDFHWPMHKCKAKEE